MNTCRSWGHHENLLYTSLQAPCLLQLNENVWYENVNISIPVIYHLYFYPHLQPLPRYWASYGCDSSCISQGEWSWSWSWSPWIRERQCLTIAFNLKISLSGPTCPTDWSQFEGKCYKYFDNTVKWDEAREHCLSEKVLILFDCLFNLSFFFFRLIWLLSIPKKKMIFSSRLLAAPLKSG